MKIISHRGNICGPIIGKENRPSYIDSAIQLGYDVEVDLRFINNEFWLGHDFGQYKIELSWIEPRKEKLWFHCKDIEAALELIKLNNGYKFFCHSNDSYVLTSTNNLWVHDLNGKVNENCIIPLLDEKDIESYDNETPYAICTDFVNLIKNEK